MFKQQNGKNSSDTVPVLQVVDPGLQQVSRGISGSSSSYFKNSSDLQLLDRPLSRNNSGYTVGGGGSSGLFNSKTAGYFKPSSSIASVDEHFSLQHFDNPDVTGGSSGNSSYFKHSSSVGAVTEDQFSMQHCDRIEATHSSLFSDEPKINQWASALITDPKFDASSDKEHKLVCVPPGLRSSERGSSPPGLIGGDRSLSPPGLISGDRSSSPPGLIGGDRSLSPPGLVGGGRSLSPPGLQKPVHSSSSLVIMDPNGVELLPLVTASPSVSSSSQLDLIVNRIPGLFLKDEPVEVVKEEFVEVEDLSDKFSPLKNQQVEAAAVGLQEGSSKTKQRTLKDFFRPVAK
jgi:hypothetical protein